MPLGRREVQLRVRQGVEQLGTGLGIPLLYVLSNLEEARVGCPYELTECHGFDPHGKTTGFILWIGGRGLMVDPPVGSSGLLRHHGVSPARGVGKQGGGGAEILRQSHGAGNHSRVILSERQRGKNLPLVPSPSVLRGRGLG